MKSAYIFCPCILTEKLEYCSLANFHERRMKSVAFIAETKSTMCKNICIHPFSIKTPTKAVMLYTPKSSWKKWVKGLLFPFSHLFYTLFQKHSLVGFLSLEKTSWGLYSSCKQIEEFPAVVQPWLGKDIYGQSQTLWSQWILC